MDYSKNNLWKWVLLCVVIGVIACGLMYYFFFANRGGYIYNPQDNNYQQTAPTVKNDQQLMSASQSLDVEDVNQIDAGLNQNDADADAF